MAVAVVFAVGLVVAQVVADQVAQREAVVRDDVVDRFARRAPARLEQVRRARQPQREFAARAVAAQPEGAHGVAEAVVPFQPAARETGPPGSRRGRCPRARRSASRACQHRVLRHGLEERAVALEAVRRRGRAPVPGRSGSRRRASPAPSSAGCPSPSAARAGGACRACCRSRCSSRSGRAGRAAGGTSWRCPGRASSAWGRARRLRRCGCRPRPAAPRCRRRAAGCTMARNSSRGAPPAGGVARVGAEEAERVVAPVVAQAHLHQALPRPGTGAPAAGSPR